jgi:hypothetical protein
MATSSVLPLLTQLYDRCAVAVQAGSTPQATSALDGEQPVQVLSSVESAAQQLAVEAGAKPLSHLRETTLKGDCHYTLFTYSAIQRVCNEASLRLTKVKVHS